MVAGHEPLRNEPGMVPSKAADSIWLNDSTIGPSQEDILEAMLWRTSFEECPDMSPIV